MTPRLAHTKSRAGCLRCKARKVKCGEEKPGCVHCARHNAVCQYPSRNRAEQPAASVSQHVQQEQEESHEDLQIEKLLTPDQRRQLELQLLHQFTSCVVWTLGSSSHRERGELWSTTAVEMSFEYPFLQNSIFAFSALHLLKRAPTSRRFFSLESEKDAAVRALNRNFKISCSLPPAEIHRAYLNLALKQEQDAVKSVNPESANALFLSTLLLSYQAYPQFSAESKQETYELPTQWLRMVAANRTIARMCVELTPDKSLVRAMAGSDGPDFSDHEALFHPTNCKPFEALLDWSLPEPAPLNAVTKATYEMFLAYVGGVHKAFAASEPPRVLFRRLICLAVLTPAEFITLIEEQRPRALVILAHFSAMTQLLDDHWVWHGFAEREVRGIQSLLPQEWMWAMEWPCKMLEDLKQRPRIED